EAPWHGPLVNAAFEEQGEGVAAVAELPQPLTPLGREPHRDACERLNANACGDFAAAPADGRAGPERCRDLTAEIVGEPRAGLAGAQCSAAGERGRAGDARPLAAQKRPGGQLDPVDSIGF